ncbi:T/G mismatch-specific endonuclease [Streptomyces melanosporofaciens]|uniref:T/G mismatch-specific endonuclease n=1 Tax=Streptomyces melanosporofaciens TaxID=67327 RepID=A0A1H4RNT8_STRMJ|nr:T/G mismatch-specific endonuclease [Streptomyces melanosporofaciens]
MIGVTGSHQEGWRRQGPPPDRAWRGKPGRSRAALTAEQDRAAGGRAVRYVDLGEGRYALASIALKVLPKTRRIRAYLRWSDEGRTPTKYVCEVCYPTRARNLAAAWAEARARGLVGERQLPSGSWASSSSVRASMRGNRGKDTVPEKALRSLLHGRGLRYRVSARPVPTLRRTADLVFTRARVAVFVDGCYWHGCPEHLRPATTNSAFWQDKIAANRVRDAETDRILAEEGWDVLRFWEHEDPEVAAERVADLVREKTMGATAFRLSH